jgi:two-component system NtrC family response regulator
MVIVFGTGFAHNKEAREEKFEMENHRFRSFTNLSVLSFEKYISREGDAMSDEKKIKLMLVDDEEDFLNSLAKRLGKRDFDIATATEGKLAIKLAKKEKFDVAILDMKMPGMDGMELLQILKKKHKFLEIIILTGYGGIDSAVEATKLGAYSYLEKPYDFEKLLDVLKNAYETRLRKKFEHDKKRMEDLEMLSMGSSPLGILRSLRQLDDDKK